MHALVIRQLPNSDPPQFQVVREDLKSSQSVEVASPFTFPVSGRPNSSLMLEMQWYLEEFLEYPFPPNTGRAEVVLDALENWGRQAFEALFGSGKANSWFYDYTRSGSDKLRLQVMSDDPQTLQWPWEAVLDPESTYLGLDCQVERRLNKVKDAVALAEGLPSDRINVLLVTCRPFKEDIRYRSISRPLVELIEREKIPAKVHVLRPPTFENLKNHLKANPGHYHLIHFDGHGGFGIPIEAAENAISGAAVGDPHRYKSEATGTLVFEDNDGEPDPVTADTLSALLRDHKIPAMVLNACRSAMLDHQAQDPFSSVAAALVKAGIRSVVAMSYSLYVSGAQEFLSAFYRELFDSGDFSSATRAGRRQMYAQRKRICVRGRHELMDFTVPVIYHQEPYTLSFGAEAVETGEKVELSPEARDESNPYGFVGRDYELLKLERSLRKDAPAILIQGLGGVGKTTLASGLVRWLADTGGMDGCLWFNFREIRTAESVINSIGTRIFGKDFIVADLDQRLAALAEALNELRLIIVWDNFEVVAGIKGTYIKASMSAEDRELLLRFLEKLRGGKSKVVITSRSEEDWLGVQRLKVSIGGLQGEERWEFCQEVLDNLGLPVERDDGDLIELMDLLNGHPLAMRVVLPRLEKLTAKAVIDAIRGNMEALGEDADSLYGTLRFAADNIDDELKVLLLPLALHEQYVDADYLEPMVKQAASELPRDKIDGFLRALVPAGLLRDVGQNTYELHPALTGFLRTTVLLDEPDESCDSWSRAFVEVMSRVANQVAPLELYQQRPHFHCHTANFHYALAEAERLKMITDQKAITQSLASWSLNTRDFAEAEKLFERFKDLSLESGDEENAANAHHELGVIAQEQRDFKTAEKWYLKSLEITERLGDEHGAAITYHQLGRIAGLQRDLKTAEGWYIKAVGVFERLNIEHHAASTYHQLGRIAEEQRNLKTAEEWYIKSLEITERQGNESGAAITYHQLGIIAEKQLDFKTAEKWFIKSLEIEEKLGNEQGAASTYHQLGTIAEEQRDFKTAEKWYFKSLEIKERLGDEYGAASTYHQLGRIAQEQQDFKTAEKWYLKALEIKERLGNEYGAAMTYGQLGILAGLQQQFEESGGWLIKGIRIFDRVKDSHGVRQAKALLANSYRQAAPDVQRKLKAMWEKAGLGTLLNMDDSGGR